MEGHGGVSKNKEDEVGGGGEVKGDGGVSKNKEDELGGGSYQFYSCKKSYTFRLLTQYNIKDKMGILNGWN